MNDFSEAQKTQLRAELTEGIKQLALTVSEQQQDLLIAYLEQLVKWNQVYNLSGIKDPARMLVIHILDSLSVLPYLPAGQVLDVGTGAGLPGIPLAICKPECDVSLLDSNGKKTRFLFQVCAELAINNTKVIQARIENYKQKKKVDIVVSRAYSSLAQFIAQTRHLLGERSKLLAMKGIFPEQELNDLPDDFKLQESHELKIPGESGTRHLLELTRVR